MLTISIDNVRIGVSESESRQNAEFIKEALFGKRPNDIIANSAR
jgi:hypothetical protein